MAFQPHANYFLYKTSDITKPLKVTFVSLSDMITIVASVIVLSGPNGQQVFAASAFRALRFFQVWPPTQLFDVCCLQNKDHWHGYRANELSIIGLDAILFCSLILLHLHTLRPIEVSLSWQLATSECIKPCLTHSFLKYRGTGTPSGVRCYAQTSEETFKTTHENVDLVLLKIHIFQWSLTVNSK